MSVIIKFYHAREIFLIDKNTHYRCTPFLTPKLKACRLRYRPQSKICVPLSTGPNSIARLLRYLLTCTPFISIIMPRVQRYISTGLSLHTCKSMLHFSARYCEFHFSLLRQITISSFYILSSIPRYAKAKDSIFSFIIQFLSKIQVLFMILHCNTDAR